MNPPTIQYNPRGYEASYEPNSDACTVIVRGFIDANGKIVERGGPDHSDDKVFARFTIPAFGAAGFSPQPLPNTVRDTFHDALADHRDLLGAPMFRHKPADDVERRCFAAAYDVAQKIRSVSTILGVNKLLFSLNPSLFAIVDCFSRDKSGAFWLMNYGNTNNTESRTAHEQFLSLAAYILEVGEYVPSTATVRLGVWSLEPSGSRFTEVRNNRAATRDVIIAHLLKTPF